MHNKPLKYAPATKSVASTGLANARRLAGRYALKGESVLEPVVQEETTGCGIASVANILGKTYSEMKAVANAMGIHASDKSLWSDTQYVRRMLSSAGVKTSADEAPFESWEALPNLALLYSSAWEVNHLCWIRLVTCHPISVRISTPCSQSGSLRSKMHNQALLSPLSRLGRLTLRSSRPTACR